MGIGGHVPPLCDFSVLHSPFKHLHSPRKTPSNRALRAHPEKLQLMIEIAEPRFLADFVFQMMHRARCLDRLDAAATRANQIVAVFSRD